jgi:hypothetical protein
MGSTLHNNFVQETVGRDRRLQLGCTGTGCEAGRDIPDCAVPAPLWTSMCSFSPASCPVLSNQPDSNYMNLGNVSRRPLDITTILTAPDITEGFSRGPYQAVTSQRRLLEVLSDVISWSVVDAVAKRKKSCGIIAVPPCEFNFSIFLDLQRFLPGGAALYYFW